MTRFKALALVPLVAGCGDMNVYGITVVDASAVDPYSVEYIQPWGEPPVVEALPAEITARMGERVELSVTASDPDGWIKRIEWRAEDKILGFHEVANWRVPFTAITTEDVVHIVTVEVKDNDANAITDTVRVTVPGVPAIGPKRPG